MTTIIYNAKENEIGVDSRMTCGDTILDDSYQKSKKVSGVLFFCTGNAGDFDLAIENYFSEHPTEIIPDCTLLVADKGSVKELSFDGSGNRFITDVMTSYGYGSGGLWALAALDHGKSTREAVKYAISRDCFSGGKVKVIKL
ncbi:hypothetical protein [Vibrio casei]|uniref:hypothetical protein n=1 Tax=Vibrio casei TaxID=673372 RepID=UPI003F959EE4